MDSLSRPGSQSTRRHKRVHFKRDSILVDERIIESQGPYLQQHNQQQKLQHHVLDYGGTLSHNGLGAKDTSLDLDSIPPLFRCKSHTEIRHVINTGRRTIADIFRGYNALHWYCNAKSTSPGIIQQLLYRGIDINALDQRTHARAGYVIRHTALGYACRNANVKAIHTLLRNGADPCGAGVTKKDSRGKPIVRPSPLQELLCQPIHGPRPGQCPWTYHLSEENEERDAYLDENDPERLPELRTLTHLSAASLKDEPLCLHCAADFHIWEPWPTTEEEKAARRERRQSCYAKQITRVGKRVQTCVQLLLNYNNNSDPPLASFTERDDPHLWSALDYFLETFWRFFYPSAICGSTHSACSSTREFPSSPEHLSHVLSQDVFSPFGDICDMLIESAGYEGEQKDGVRGTHRLVSLIAAHPEFSSFRQGEYFDVDARLEELMLDSSSSN
ncbi:hypothetical protein F4678DRAFT_370162 [Xylaria arbuscula]|nr:hypothetical protein F4678DRAFT_370162 [Xylaria arbuscula]